MRAMTALGGGKTGNRRRTAMVLLLCSLCATAQALEKKQPEIPLCAQKLGTLSVAEPERKWWHDYNLESPESLIKVLVSQSKCFTLLDRGKGMAAAQSERALASNGDLRGGSNIGKGQIKAADYVLVPDIVNENSRAGGTRIGGLVGGLVGGTAGAVIGGVSLNKKTADVVLTLTDVRSTEQVSLQQGHGQKTDLGWGGGGGAFFGLFAAGGASGYASTEIGQVVTLAYLDAFTKMVNDIKTLDRDVKAENVSQSVTMSKPGRMYAEPDLKAQVVRDLDPGMLLYPSGDKQGIWWKVSDELGNEGWVSSVLFQLAK